MKRNASLVLFLLVLNVSCAPSLSATPTTTPTSIPVQVATATATQVVLPTATATQSAMLTGTATPTVTRTNTPMPTATPTPEITPAPMKVWKEFRLTSTDYRSAGFVATNKEFNGADSYYEAIPDPTGMLGGYVIHATIKGEPPDTQAIKDNSGVHRPYSVYYTTDSSGSWALEFSSVLDALPTTEVYANSAGGAIGKKWVSIVTAGLGKENNLGSTLAGAFLVTDRGVPHLELYTVNKGISTAHNNPLAYEKPIPYPIREKVAIRVEFSLDAKGKPTVRLFQNYRLVDEAVIEDTDAIGLPGRKIGMGLYAGQGVRGPLNIWDSGLTIYTP